MAKIKNKKNNNDHYVGALLEHMDSKIDVLVDGHKFLTDGQKILESKMGVLDVKMTLMNTKVGALDGKVDDLKSEITKRFNKLEEKVGRDEFIVLEKRVTALERAKA